MKFWIAWLIYYWGGVHRYFGLTNGVVQEFERAAACFSRALRLVPDFRDARLALAKVRGRELGQHEKAIADLNILLGRHPQDADALFTRAQFYQDLGRYEAALTDLQAYLRLPDQPHTDLAARSAAYLRAIVADGEQPTGNGERGTGNGGL